MSAPRTERPVRIGYARTSTARQELASRLEALHRAECHKVFQEQLSTRIKVRPELEKALALARQCKEVVHQTPVVFTVHELKRLTRNAPEPMTLSAELQADDIQLELLTCPPTGLYDLNGMGASFFAMLAPPGRSSAATSAIQDRGRAVWPRTWDTDRGGGSAACERRYSGRPLPHILRTWLITAWST
ncbi:recombinase family protein [Streptomyces javensis]|uniref:recombinase family protein n=1 Tax=Streptomyces javensis TaxID=114698 RepID=UPI0033FC3C46